MVSSVNIHQAKTQLSKLIARAEAGEEIVIARNGVPIVRLEAVAANVVTRKKRSLFGAMRGEFVLPSDDEWRGMDEEIAREMLESSIFPEDDVPRIEAAE